MSNILEYKNYIGSIEISGSDNMFFGKVLGINSLLYYEGKDAQSLINDFHGVVDEYLELCADKNIEPEISCSGRLNIRISPELHKKAIITAIDEHISINSFVENAVRAAIEVN